jgi:hypothetical protein
MFTTVSLMLLSFGIGWFRGRITKKRSMKELFVKFGYKYIYDEVMLKELEEIKKKGRETWLKIEAEITKDL